MWHNMYHDIVWKKKRSCYFLNCFWKKMCWTYCSVCVHKNICCVLGRNTLWGMLAALEGICTTNKSAVSTTRFHFRKSLLWRALPLRKPLFVSLPPFPAVPYSQIKGSTGIEILHSAVYSSSRLGGFLFQGVGVWQYLSALSLSAEH